MVCLFVYLFIIIIIIIYLFIYLFIYLYYIYIYIYIFFLSVGVCELQVCRFRAKVGMDNKPSLCLFKDKLKFKEVCNTSSQKAGTHEARTRFI